MCARRFAVFLTWHSSSECSCQPILMTQIYNKLLAAIERSFKVNMGRQ